MAAPIYCTHRELKRVFPQLDSFDGKKPIYGWSVNLTNVWDSQIEAYYANNTGLITQLFWDGAEVDNFGFPTSAATTLSTNVTNSYTNIPVSDASAFGSDDIIKVNNEYMRIVSIDGSNLQATSRGVNRGLFGTAAQNHSSGSSVFLVIDASEDVADSESADPDGLGFVYDSDLDLCILLTSTGDPNDYLVEAGEDFTTLVTQYRTDASRYLDSMLDPNMPKEAWKDKNGNYDYIIIRTTALLAANFMIKAHDPNSELANALMEEAMNNIANINAGKAALSWQVTRDSSQGVVRDVVYNTAGAIRPVDTRGEWVGTYDLIKVIITTGGALGTAKYSVFTKDNVKLKNNESVSNEIIIGDYQPLAGGLEIRFAGSSDAIQNDEWEIECFGRYEDVDASSGKAIKMTRIRTYRGY